MLQPQLNRAEASGLNNGHKWKKGSAENTCYAQSTEYVVECLHLDKYDNFNLTLEDTGGRYSKGNVHGTMR